eukprot:COSAG02_NODE_7018_length_3224_cov_96.199360_2_plen_94_part_00
MGTPWEHGAFHLSIMFADGYPFKPPLVRFKTRMHHPSIGPQGELDLPMLDTYVWTASRKVVEGAFSLRRGSTSALSICLHRFFTFLCVQCLPR